jgi:hypothetical protein
MCCSLVSVQNFDVCWHPKGRRIACGSSDGVVRIFECSGKSWRKEKSRLSPKRQFDLHEGIIKSVAWDSYGRYLASMGSDGKVIITDSQNEWRRVRTISISGGRVDRSPVARLSWEPLSQVLYIPLLSAGPDTAAIGQIDLSASRDSNEVELVDLKQRGVVHSIRHCPVVFRRDPSFDGGKEIAGFAWFVTLKSKEFTLMNTLKETPFCVATGVPYLCQDASWSPDGSHLLIAGDKLACVEIAREKMGEPANGIELDAIRRAQGVEEADVLMELVGEEECRNMMFEVEERKGEMEIEQPSDFIMKASVPKSEREKIGKASEFTVTRQETTPLLSSSHHHHPGTTRPGTEGDSGVVRKRKRIVPRRVAEEEETQEESLATTQQEHGSVGKSALMNVPELSEEERFILKRAKVSSEEVHESGKRKKRSVVIGDGAACGKRRIMLSEKGHTRIQLQCLDESNGETLWMTLVETPEEIQDLVANASAICLVMKDGSVFAFETETGMYLIPKWVFPSVILVDLSLTHLLLLVKEECLKVLVWFLPSWERVVSTSLPITNIQEGDIQAVRLHKGAVPLLTLSSGHQFMYSLFSKTWMADLVKLPAVSMSETMKSRGVMDAISYQELQFAFALSSANAPSDARIALLEYMFFLISFSASDLCRRRWLCGMQIIMGQVENDGIHPVGRCWKKIPIEEIHEIREILMRHAKKSPHLSSTSALLDV